MIRGISCKLFRCRITSSPPMPGKPTSTMTTSSDGRRCGFQKRFTIRITFDGVAEIAQDHQKRIRNGCIIFNYMNTQDDSFSLEQLSALNSNKCPSKIHQSKPERCTQ